MAYLPSKFFGTGHTTYKLIIKVFNMSKRIANEKNLGSKDIKTNPNCIIKAVYLCALTITCYTYYKNYIQN